MSADTFSYRRCAGCQVVFLENPPDDLVPYYAGGYHSIPGPAELEASSAREAYKVGVLRDRVSTGALVDVGPSYGGFPYLARAAGYDVTAIEVDPDCCAFIEATIGARAIQSGEPELVLRDMDGLDAVTLWHSIEHLGQPWRTLEAAAHALRPGGALIVATPNPAGLQARLLRGRWVHVDAPRHLFLIPPAALAARAASLGLETVSTSADDEETRRCNVFGWTTAAGDLGIDERLPGHVGNAVARAVSPLEGRPMAGSAYTSVFIKRGA